MDTSHARILRLQTTPRLPSLYSTRVLWLYMAIASKLIFRLPVRKWIRGHLPAGGYQFRDAIAALVQALQQPVECVLFSCHPIGWDTLPRLIDDFRGKVANQVEPRLKIVERADVLVNHSPRVEAL